MDIKLRPAPTDMAAVGTTASGSPGYMSGFGNEFATEALPGALPMGRNSPQNCPYDLYAEQISGTSFTAPRASNRRSWVYRLVPAAVHQPFRRIDNGRLAQPDIEPASPNQMRWDPLPIPPAPTDFIDGMVTMAGQGDPAAMSGCAIHLYVANRSMTDRYFYDADGELLIVPQQGRLHVHTELGLLDVAPQEICVIPRGLRFQVRLPDLEAGIGPPDGVRGYICENFGAPLRLPDLGVIGANGLANPRDFLTPVAAFEDREGDFELVCKFLGNLWSAGIDHSPLDVVAWHGNHAPYKYDLRNYNAIGSVSFDHTDPSLLLVLQSQSDTPGIDSLDFLVFPPRYMAARDTFRPPWFHRNVASEFMGLIQGVYDSKAEGFHPGGVSLHNCMTGHGPDTETFTKGIAADTSTPHYIEGSIAFMFETRLPIRPTRQALECKELQKDYNTCWDGLKKRFRPPVSRL